jgi:TPR repeat protein
LAQTQEESFMTNEELEQELMLGAFESVENKNYKKAVEHFRKAAEGGNPKGQFFLGLEYIIGRGISENRNEAIKWFRLAAAQGHEDAKKQLKEMGVPLTAPSAPAPSARSGGSSSDLTGTKWIQGKGKPFANIYKFMPDGIIGNGGLRGKWSQNGNSVTFSFGSEMSKSTTDCKIVSSNTMKGKMKIEYLQTFSASGKNYKKGDIEYRDWDLEKM